MDHQWYERPEFLDLRDSFYKKLEEEGFYDIETNLRTTRQPGPLLRGSPSAGDLSRNLFREDKEEYYRWARQHYHEMPDTTAKTIWYLHACGESLDSIWERLEGHYPDISRRLIGRVIKWEEEAMRQKGEAHPPAGDSSAEALLGDLYPAGVDVQMRGSVK